MAEPTSLQILWVIAGMAVLNFALRVTPMATLASRKLPRPIMRWLSFIPIAVMGALVASEVLRPSQQWQPPVTNPGVWAALLTMIAFRFTRSFLGASLTGMVSFVAIRAMLG